MSIEQKLAELNIELPPMPKAAGAYVPSVKSGNMLYLSGQLPIKDGKVAFTGKVGSDVTIEDSQTAARYCIINALTVIKGALGSLDNVKKIVKLEVFVNSAPGFTDQAIAANGASLLLNEVFGDAGLHARAAVGVAELPLDAAVELAVIVESL
ncbi:MAG: RidA family protein [Phycisphaerae bacterium]|nr:RidA family protein [Phycisphaerae bacterium]